MNDHSDNSYIGLSINPDQMCLVLMQNNSIQNLASKDLVQSFDMETILSQNKFLDTQKEILQDLYKSLGSGQEVGISLYSGCVLIKRIPIALGLDNHIIKDQLFWEAQQFIVSSLGDYIIDYQRLPFQTFSGNPLYVVVLIRKKILAIIKQLVEKTGMILKDIDVDVFSNIRSLVVNYQIKEGINVLVDLQREYICIIFIKNEEFFLSNIISLQKKDKTTIVNVAEISDLLLKELKRLIFGHKIVNKLEDINTIYLSGVELVHDLQGKLSQSIEVPTEIINPFSKITISKSVLNKDEYGKNPEKFTSSVGVALKKYT